MFANFCLWLYYTFEVPKSALSQVEQDFYGLKTWVYLQRIILPCCIFFRWVNSSVRCVGSTAAYLEAEESYNVLKYLCLNFWTFYKYLARNS